MNQISNKQLGEAEAGPLSTDDFYEEFMRIANPELMKNLNPLILNSLQDGSKIKRKIYIPKNPGVNYVGLLIGPQGHY